MHVGGCACNGVRVGVAVLHADVFWENCFLYIEGTLYHNQATESEVVSMSPSNSISDAFGYADFHLSKRYFCMVLIDYISFSFYLKHS